MKFPALVLVSLALGLSCGSVSASDAPQIKYGIYDALAAFTCDVEIRPDGEGVILMSPWNCPRESLRDVRYEWTSYVFGFEGAYYHAGSSGTRRSVIVKESENVIRLQFESGRRYRFKRREQ